MTMKIFTRLITGLILGGLAITGFSNARAQESQSPLTILQNNSRIHVFPTARPSGDLVSMAPDAGPLVYHNGPVMLNATTYAIFWLPAKLQDGTPTSVSPLYKSLLRSFLADYPRHGIDNNNTQYYQGAGASSIYIHNNGAFGGGYTDTSPYPMSKCFDSATPGNCLTDTQIQNEIKKVMTLTGWTGGLGHMFLVFTSAGEGSCLSAASSICAYTYYCAYHNSIVSGVPAPIIYSNEPYADTSVCQVPLAPSPSGDPAADDAAAIASHELTEAITDPLLTAWFTAMGNEVGDLCAYNYGTLTWDSGQANEFWNGHPYLLQQEFDNHTGVCVQLGP